nr:retropepsin-like aspartic protease [uncultured Flavobacterium sp.]
MKKIKIFIFIIFTNICLAQDINLNQGNAKNPNYYSEIPFEYVNGKIIIPVQINNKTYKFLLDTGAPNCISKNLTINLNPKILNEIKVSDADDNKSVLNVVELPDLIIGNIAFENSLALSYNEEKNLVFDCFNIDGFIGSNLLRNSIIQINIKKKTLTITNEKSKLKFNNKNGTKLTLIGTQSSPYIWIKIKGKSS